MERISKIIFKIIDIGTETKKLNLSMNKFIDDNSEVLRKVMSEDEVSVFAFLKLYDTRTYDVKSRQNDIKYMKELDFKGLYIVKNLTKKKYYLGYGDRVFRKVYRHFRGYGNQEIFEDFKQRNAFVVSFGRFDSNTYDSLEAYVNKTRIHLKSKLEGYKHYESVSTKQKTEEQDATNKPIETIPAKNVINNNDWSLKKKRLKAFLFNRKRIILNFPATALIGRNCSEVIEMLTENGFIDIEPVPVRDIYTDNLYMPGEVELVTIDGNNVFERGEEVRYDAKIKIIFHLKKKFSFPYSSRQMKKLNCDVLFKELCDIGFTKINMLAIKDLKKGWLVKENSVEKVTVCGDENYKKGQEFNYDVEIAIYYHTFK